MPPDSAMKQVSGSRAEWSLVSGPTRPMRWPCASPFFTSPRRVARLDLAVGALHEAGGAEAAAPQAAARHLGEEEVAELGVGRVDAPARWRCRRGRPRSGAPPAPARRRAARSGSPTGRPARRCRRTRPGSAPARSRRGAGPARRAAPGAAGRPAARRQARKGSTSTSASPTSTASRKGATGSGLICMAMPPATTSGQRPSRAAARGGRPARARSSGRWTKSSSKESVKATTSKSLSGVPDSTERGASGPSGRKTRSQRACGRVVEEPVDGVQPQVGHPHPLGVRVDERHRRLPAGVGAGRCAAGPGWGRHGRSSIAWAGPAPARVLASPPLGARMTTRLAAAALTALLAGCAASPARPPPAQSMPDRPAGAASGPPPGPPAAAPPGPRPSRSRPRRPGCSPASRSTASTASSRRSWPAGPARPSATAAARTPCRSACASHGGCHHAKRMVRLASALTRAGAGPRELSERVTAYYAAFSASQAGGPRPGRRRPAARPGRGAGGPGRVLRLHLPLLPAPAPGAGEVRRGPPGARAAPLQALPDREPPQRPGGGPGRRVGPRPRHLLALPRPALPEPARLGHRDGRLGLRPGPGRRGPRRRPSSRGATCRRSTPRGPRRGPPASGPPPPSSSTAASCRSSRPTSWSSCWSWRWRTRRSGCATAAGARDVEAR